MGYKMSRLTNRVFQTNHEALHETGNLKHFIAFISSWHAPTRHLLHLNTAGLWFPDKPARKKNVAYVCRPYPWSPCLSKRLEWLGTASCRHSQSKIFSGQQTKHGLAVVSRSTGKQLETRQGIWQEVGEITTDFFLKKWMPELAQPNKLGVKTTAGACIDCLGKCRLPFWL